MKMVIESVTKPQEKAAEKEVVIVDKEIDTDEEPAIKVRKSIVRYMVDGVKEKKKYVSPKTFMKNIEIMKKKTLQRTFVSKKERFKRKLLRRSLLRGNMFNQMRSLMTRLKLRDSSLIKVLAHSYKVCTKGLKQCK